MPIKPGRILFEVDGVSKELAKQALSFGAGKLPVRTRFISRSNNLT
jgi:large subunit ribosomal protein L16